MDCATPSLSLVILCYRAGESAREFVQRMRQALEGASIDYHLVLVGNYVEGADDRTPAVVKELAGEDPRVDFVAVPKQGWMGWDMRKGLEMASGRFVGVIDGDGQFPVGDVPPLYELIRHGEYDLVKSYRIARGDGLKRKVISYIYNGLFHLLFPGTPAKDINAKAKILRREAYEKLRLTSDDWFIDAEIMIQARRFGFRVGELPTEFLGLSGRRSFIRMRVMLEFLVNLVRYRVREFGVRRR